MRNILRRILYLCVFPLFFLLARAAHVCYCQYCWLEYQNQCGECHALRPHLLSVVARRIAMGGRGGGFRYGEERSVGDGKWDICAALSLSVCFSFFRRARVHLCWSWTCMSMSFLLAFFLWWCCSLLPSSSPHHHYHHPSLLPVSGELILSLSGCPSCKARRCVLCTCSLRRP